MTQQEKLIHLKKLIQDMERVVIAFSGGVDSTFLLKIAWDILGEGVTAVTATSSTYPERELKEAVQFARQLGCTHEIISSEELEIEGFAQNPTNRCYYCKHELFSKLGRVAERTGAAYVLDGSNLDDLKDFRPGMHAAKELGVVSPLKEAALTKEDIRQLSKQLGLPTWNKPAFACLSSRFPYGEVITVEKLKMVEEAEQFLLDLGFCQLRVRIHESMARIEVAPEERARFFDMVLMNQVDDKLKKIGFSYVTLDLKGYRTGSMNEVLDESVRRSSAEKAIDTKK
ncbi:ATP-dependent sacrificial sulfur transferase LarE [Anoxynatronum sibiricum]|uniref:ATP-dependent sacrificial sulfur transferase LarE n=1 Tax=Anoxynatronum sibiricum TaxID=210623 RepID=A0ABU9VQU8_9CLOT